MTLKVKVATYSGSCQLTREFLPVKNLIECQVALIQHVDSIE